MKILILDDDIRFSKQLQENLTHNNHIVRVATNLHDGFILFKEISFDLVLLDYKLGLENGLNLLNQASPHLPVPKAVLMTSFATKEVAIEALNLGVYRFLEKPFKVKVLHEIIDSLKLDTPKSQISLDSKTLVAIEAGKRIPLTLLEFRILNFILENQNQLITKDELHQHIYENDIKAKNAVNTHLTNLKAKLSTNFSNKLKTIRSKGYIFETDS